MWLEPAAWMPWFASSSSRLHFDFHTLPALLPPYVHQRKAYGGVCANFRSHGHPNVVAGGWCRDSRMQIRPRHRLQLLVATVFGGALVFCRKRTCQFESAITMMARKADQKTRRIRLQRSARLQQLAQKEYLTERIDKAHAELERLREESNTLHLEGRTEAATEISDRADLHKRSLIELTEKRKGLFMTHQEELYRMVQKQKVGSRVARDSKSPVVDVHELAPGVAQLKMFQAIVKARRLGNSGLQVITGIGRGTDGKGGVVRQHIFAIFKELVDANAKDVDQEEESNSEGLRVSLKDQVRRDVRGASFVKLGGGAFQIIFRPDLKAESDSTLNETMPPDSSQLCD